MNSINGINQINGSLPELMESEDSESESDEQPADPRSYQLHNLASAGETEAIEILVRENPGVDVDVTDENNDTPLHIAARKGHCEALRVLSRLEADIDSYKLFNDKTPLHCAIEGGQLDAAETLLELGATVDSFDYMRVTPLGYACEYGHTEIARRLLMANANVHHSDLEDLQALHKAASHDLPELIALLLEYGADPNVLADARHRTPLHQAASRGNALAVRALLAGNANPDGLRNGADRHQQLAEVNHCTPICFAIISGHTSTVAALLEYGADPCLIMHFGRGIQEVLMEILRQLLEVRYPVPGNNSPPVDPSEIMKDLAARPEWHADNTRLIEVHEWLIDRFYAKAMDQADSIENLDRIAGIEELSAPLQTLFGPFLGNHGLVCEAMSPLRYSVLTEKSDIITLLVNSKRYSPEDINDKRALAEAYNLAQSLEALSRIQAPGHWATEESSSTQAGSL